MIKKLSAQRVRWHLNRTPLVHVIKAACRASQREAVRCRRALLGELPDTAAIRSHAAALREQGFAQVDDLVDPRRLDHLSRAGEAKLARARTQLVEQHSHQKDFWTRLLDEDMDRGTLPLDSAFVQIALQPELVAVVGHAIGELPRLDYVLLTLSHPTGDRHSSSQLWHRDHDDTHVIKLFVYLTDVQDSEDGPFTFIPRPQSARMGFRLRSHQDDDTIFGTIPRQAVRAIVAPRLSAFMVDTARCLHMGSRVAAGHERLLYTATFISAPRLYPEPPPRFRLDGTESALLTQLVCGA